MTVSNLDPSLDPSLDPTLDPALGPAAAPTADVERGRRWWSALTHGRGLVGVSLVLIVVVAGLLAPLLASYGPEEQLLNANLLPPSGSHPLGTDEVNRDVLSRLLHGIRVDLVVAFVAVPIGALIGVLVGVLSAMNAVADVVAQRAFDVLLAFPALILGVGVTAAMGPGTSTIVVVILLAEIPVFGRLVRTSLLTVRALPYVESARVMGAGTWWMVRKHLLPNSLEPLTVQISVSMSIAIFLEGALSFLGLGVRPPSPSLGSLIKDGVRNIWQAPTFVIGPLVVVSALVLGFLLIAQAFSRARRV